MKTIFSLIILGFFSITSFAQHKSQVGKADPAKKMLTAEASCGKCQLGLKGKTCDLAVRIDGKAYYVDGASIDDFGDAHDKDGFCNAIRKAEVQGEVVNDRFKLTYIKLLPGEKKEKKD